MPKLTLSDLKLTLMNFNDRVLQGLSLPRKEFPPQFFFYDKKGSDIFKQNPSVTNFLFVNTKPLGIFSSNLVKVLQENNIWVKDFGFKLGLDGYYFRTAVSTPNENQKLQVALGEAISEII
ncbi:MAG: hypothetical protein F6K40_02420 [Okeania sp. SIO3I5]|uniref:hypothetical protein n=1 Tax=Okeania sp. SIO3I5 TaxID=2607805 RepID=UPI0013B8A983|nr:hypothetical protein [Okeania sp. SIO3I5]NEQ35222.1 hypothetical protein [Okeania sp. SIO3I5]